MLYENRIVEIWRSNALELAFLSLSLFLIQSALARLDILGYVAVAAASVSRALCLFD